MNLKCSGTLLINTFLAWTASLNSAFIFYFFGFWVSVESWQNADSMGLELHSSEIAAGWGMHLRTQGCYGLFKCQYLL